MALSSGQFLKGHHNLRHVMGAEATNSDACLVVDGYENFFIKIKAFPDPTLQVNEAVEIPMPLGDINYKPGQAKTGFSGSASFVETETRDVEQMLHEIKYEKGGYFNAWLYQGTPDFFVNRKRLIKCFFTQSAPVQRDFSSNTEILLIEGDIYGHYFGEIEEGNAGTLMGGH